MACVCVFVCAWPMVSNRYCSDWSKRFAKRTRSRHCSSTCSSRRGLQLFYSGLVQTQASWPTTCILTRTWRDGYGGGVREGGKGMWSFLYANEGSIVSQAQSALANVKVAIAGMFVAFGITVPRENMGNMHNRVAYGCKDAAKPGGGPDLCTDQRVYLR